MKGLELNRRFSTEIVLELINKFFPFLKNKYALGLIGYGSDVLGYDDKISQDHEWGPRCYVWLSENDYNNYARDIDKMLNANLPTKFLGYSTRYKVDNELHVLVPSERTEKSIHHVALTTVSRYLKIQYELETIIPTYIEWLCLPEQKLLELTRGEIFYDPVGEISHVREKFSYLPNEIWYFKLMYAWMAIDQLDIVALCGKRGEILSAKLALHQIIQHIIRLVFLLNRKYCPGTLKWVSKEFYKLPTISKEVGEKIEKCLITNDVNYIVKEIEDIFLLLLNRHNDLHLTNEVHFDQINLSRGLTSFSVRKVIDVLYKKLPSELQKLEIYGACDQWITNTDILIWSEQYMKFKAIYNSYSDKKRDNVGDLIV